MKEIGGYIELDQNRGAIFHPDALALNTARNCLVYLIRAKQIRRIALPRFLCSSVSLICRTNQVSIRLYSINERFLPDALPEGLDEGEWLYLVNYYGQLTREQIRSYKAKYPLLIVDNVQAFFDEPAPGVDTIYTCRKFFGVPDGAFLYTDVELAGNLEQDVSYDRMLHLLGRYDDCASAFYDGYVRHEHELEAVPLRKMSRLTENLLRGIDYDAAKAQRTKNYEYLDKNLGEINRLELHTVDGAFAYPLFIRNGAELRKKLIAEKIYVPILWPNVLEETAPGTLEYCFAENILPLPCDQRYDIGEMRRICESILSRAERL